MSTTTPNQNENVHHVTHPVKPVVGGKELTIVKSFQKSTAALNVMRDDAMVMSHGNYLFK